MRAGRHVRGSKEGAACGLQGCWEKTLGCSRDFGTVSTQWREKVSSSHGVLALPQLSSALAALLLSLLSSGAALSPPGSWTLHEPQPVQGIPVSAHPNRLLCQFVQHLIKSHPCTLTLTSPFSLLNPHPYPTTSSSPLHSHLHPCILILIPSPSSLPSRSTCSFSDQSRCTLASLALP